MAITNAQQYQQLVNKPANGKRPGYRGDAAYRSDSNQSSKSSGGQGKVGSKASFGGGKGRDTSGKSEGADGINTSKTKKTNKAKLKERKDFIDKKANYNNFTPKYLQFLGNLNRKPNRNFFMDRFMEGPNAGNLVKDVLGLDEDGLSFSPSNLTEEQYEKVYQEQMKNRLSGETDAMGNPMPFTGGGIDAKSAGAERGDLLLPVQEKVIPEVEEDPKAYRFYADGGRASFQEGGGIFPRLNELGSNVSSAEQELAALSQKINSAESTLGEGGGDEGGLGSIMPENNFTNPTLEAFSGTGIPVKGGMTANVPERIQIDPLNKPLETLQATTGGGLLNNFAPGIDPMGSRKENSAGPVMQLGNSAPSTNLPGFSYNKITTPGPTTKATGQYGAPQAGDVVYDPTGMPNIYAPRNGYADGGMSEYEGGIMDLESGRQQYFLGKLVKKAGKAIKKISKSPIGKAALLAGGAGLFGFGPAKGLFASGKGLGFKNFLTKSFLGKEVSGGNPSGRGRTGGLFNFIKNNKELAGIFAGSALAGGLTPDDEEPKYANVYDDFKLKFPEQYRFAAEGGLMRNGYAEGSEEPVAKETMPLLDMDGKEMDLRAEGGFVPLGRMEKADDVPARLSKNEFVFTADAVRNAGEGDVDKGAEVMYNMMKNLEAGGDVSQESQGLDGAREMFQTSQRLEEVI